MSRFKAWGSYRVFAFVLVVVTVCSLAAGKTIYVDGDAAGANNGSSWVDAYTYLQEALGDAASAQKPVEIRVAQGTYKPNEGLMAISEFDWRTTTFQLINSVTLKGGYAGLAAPDPNARDIELYETILSGDLSGDDVEVADPKNLLAEPTRAENSYHVVNGSGTDTTTVLDGFVITAGNANVSDAHSAGGGMINESGGPTVMNCTFVTNSAMYGGGIGNLNAYPAVTNCKFIGNSAVSGAGMDNASSEPKLKSSTFYGNWSVDDAGAIRNIASTPVITNCILWDNTAPQLTGEAVVSYSNVQGGWPGEGNIDADPLFADADNGDYHLKSQAGRWDAAGGSWVMDDVTSPCIDAGDPGSPVAAEPYPNGDIINMGAYGGTAQASKSPSGNHSRYGGGIGEPNDSYLIYTAEQMNTIGLNAEDWDKHFKLMADIDLAAYSGTSFNMIGRYDIDMLVDLPFSGTFDGNGHTISNFTYSATDVNEIAMFAYVRGGDAAITNLGIIDPNVNILGQDGPTVDINDLDIGPDDADLFRGTGDRVAALVSRFRSGTVSGCCVKGGRISGRDWIGGLVASNEGIIIDCDSDTEVYGGVDVGGLVAKNAKTGAIIGCRSFGRISGAKSVGGLVGDNFTTATILDSYSAGKVAGNKNVGGLVGVSGGLISNCGSNSDVIGHTVVVGGLAGQSYGQVSDCYATGSVSGVQEVGGLVGYSRGSISRSYSTSEVVCKEIDSNMVGGLVGSNNAVITSCYSAGSVLADVIVGGLVGVNHNTIANSYSTAAVIGYSRAGGLAGQNQGAIMYCYAAGSVTEDAGDGWVGGLVSWNPADNVVASFWDVGTTGQAISNGGTGKTTAEMQSASTFLDAGWDFVDENANGTDDLWWIDEGQDYPMLSWEMVEGN